MKQIKTIALSVFILNSLFILHNSVPAALAQEFSTGINPPIFQMEAQAPALIKAPLTLENSSDQTVTYGIFLRPFKANPDKNGEPNYDADLMDEYRNFFGNVQINDENKILTEVTLTPRQQKELTLRINIPSDEKPGDHYFTVVFLAQNKESGSPGSGAGARGGIGTNVLLTVGSKAEPEGRIANFSVPKFVTGGPVSFKLDLANHSDYYVTTNGNLVIKNMFKQPVGNLEFGPLNILANSNRLIGNNSDLANPKLIWNENFLFGLYTAEVSIALSEHGPLLKQTKTFFAFPLELALVILAVLALGLIIFKRARKKNEEG